MEADVTVDQEYWPLHFALAWVLGRDRSFSERAKSSDFHPYLGKGSWTSQDEEDRAWNILHQSLVDGTVPAFFKVSEPRGNDYAEEAREERFALPETFASFHWADHGAWTILRAAAGPVWGYPGWDYVCAGDYANPGYWRPVPWGGAWRLIIYSGGRVPALARIVPEAFASFDWPDLRSGQDHSAIVLPSLAMLNSFPPNGDEVALTSDRIGPPVQPDGPGYMTLSDAAYWIATEGGAKRIVATDDSVWRQAFAELLPRIQSGEVRVVGKRRGESISGVINPESFVSLAVDYPWVDTPMALLLCEEPHIRCCGCGAAKSDQGSDELWGWDRHVPEWSHLQVHCAHVWELWRKFPKATKAIQARAGQRPPSKTELQRWYQQRIQEFNDRKTIPSVEDDERDARAEFPGVTRDMVRAARKELAPTWSKRGPRGPRKSSERP